MLEVVAELSGPRIGDEDPMTGPWSSVVGDISSGYK